MKNTILILFIATMSLTAFGKAKKQKPVFNLDKIYHQAQREFNKQNYKQALPLLEEYLDKSQNNSHKRERLFWVIDQIGRIHLRVNKDPEKALKFFDNLMTEETLLTDDEQDDIASWITAAKDWQKTRNNSKSKLKGTVLFAKGKLYYGKATKMIKFPADDKGDAYLNIAATYLVPFIINNANSKNIGEALYMMGDIRHRLRTDPDYWNDNYYLKETIRRFPGQPIAKKAWKLLESDVHLGYTGSGGDHTPPEMISMLNKYKSIAYKKAPKRVMKHKKKKTKSI